jgi:hypothetical protein
MKNEETQNLILQMLDIYDGIEEVISVALDAHVSS